jgi:hypothetical protein
MMGSMSKPRTGWVRGEVCFSTVLVIAACGGSPKQADSPGACPEGTVLRGTDCVPPEGEKDKAAAQDRAMAQSAPSSPAASKSDDMAPPVPAQEPPSGKTPYDKESVDVELKRGARQVKANCGAATDDEGKATGPWGKAKASITLGRNGHVKQVTLPPPYDGKPVALCTAHAFEKIQFPPYSGDIDAVVEWDVELVKPKGH